MVTSEKPSRIAHVAARQILDSRGRPTIEADVELTDGTVGRASVPSGASTGRHEAAELRDGDPLAYNGRGVARAVANVHDEIAPHIRGMDALDQEGIDQSLIDLDGTVQLGRLGSNAILATSIALCRASALHMGQPLFQRIMDLSGCAAAMLPMPMVNILSGGAHAGHGMDFQDFLAIPIGATSYRQSLEYAVRVRDAAEELLGERGLPVLLADEGGLSPGFDSVEEALGLMMLAIERAGLKPADDVAIALDVAASEFCNDGRYTLRRQGRQLTAEEMLGFVADHAGRYPILSIEDVLDQDDWENWSRVCAAMPGIQIVGDDLFATNVRRISRGIELNVANAVLIKLNQNGTLSGTLRALATARQGGYATIVSARSGETEDSFIADLAVGTAAGQIKLGSVRNSERLAKYNQLLRIEEAGNVAFANNDRYAWGRRE